MLMFSLAGIPPLAGFFAKFYVFVAGGRRRALWPLAVIGVLASVVGAYYYLRIVKIMYFDDAKGSFLAVPQAKAACVMALSAAVRAASTWSGRRPSSTAATRPPSFGSL